MRYKVEIQEWTEKGYAINENKERGLDLRIILTSNDNVME